ncbi:MAG: GIY-YIG nuclease family protein [Candidatus Marinimicrobia bacterium]|nr:GIY-YIG nuclease family protein [Candidatus Neomarinimicrobiota bacterium]
MKKGWNVYVIQSQRGKFRYKGMSRNPSDRLESHNAGKVRVTKHYRPFEIIYMEYVGKRSEARKRERYLKSAAGRKFIEKQIEERNEGSQPD